MARAEPIRCPFCRERHMPRFLCDPANAVLLALKERAASFDLPPMELPEPVPAAALGLDPGDRLLRQLVVNAATVDVAGVRQPVLVFTGRDGQGPLPRWYFAAEDEKLLATAGLVDQMARLAISRAGGEPGEVVL